MFVSAAGRQCERWLYSLRLERDSSASFQGRQMCCCPENVWFFSHERFFTQESGENPHVNVNDIEN